MKDLDEYTEEELDNELRRRANLRAKGLCDYCERPAHTPTCRMQERHQAAQDVQAATYELGQSWPY